jgi:hypothetical protein
VVFHLRARPDRRSASENALVHDCLRVALAVDVRGDTDKER